MSTMSRRKTATAPNRRSAPLPGTMSSLSMGRSQVVNRTPAVEPELIRLCRTRQWNSALSRLALTPEEAFASYYPARGGTALAVACQSSAPPNVIQSLLTAIGGRIRNGTAPMTMTDGEEEGRGRRVVLHPLRMNEGGRGTPLHEAVGNEEIDPEVIRMLIRADVEVGDGYVNAPSEAAAEAETNVEGGDAATTANGPSSSRSSPGGDSSGTTCTTSGAATSSSEAANAPSPPPPEPAARQPDVDGQIPLHLMIRRAFRACPRPRGGTHRTTAGSSNTRQSGSDGGTEMASSSASGRGPPANSGGDGSARSAYATAANQSGVGERPGRDTVASAGSNSSDDGSEEEDDLLVILRELIATYPEGCSVPDKREYEETPLVLALKASLYASYAAIPSGVEDDGNNNGDDAAGGVNNAMEANNNPRDTSRHHHTLANLEESTQFWENMLEERIYTVVKMIIRANPEAARYIASSGYTIIHSALFHSRSPRTVRLLLSAAGSPQQARTLCTSVNSIQSEVPLHFATMKLDELSVIRMLCEVGPAAVQCRDSRGRTPLHWLWIRFVSGTLEEDVEEGPVNFLHMRHVPVDYVQRDKGRMDLALDVLKEVMSRVTMERATDGVNLFRTGFEPWMDSLEGDGPFPPGTRNERRTTIFWTKMQSLLRASEHNRVVDRGLGDEGRTVLHAAASHSGCPRAIVQMAQALHPHFLRRRDGSGQLPLHCAASRNVRGWRPYATPRTPSYVAVSRRRSFTYETKEVILVESVLGPVLEAYPEAARSYDDAGRLPLHCAIDSYLSSLAGNEYHQTDGDDPMEYLKPLLQTFPESIERRDGVTKLYPFMQAAAASAAVSDDSAVSGNDLPPVLVNNTARTAAAAVAACPHQHESAVKHARQLTVIYGLLRICPSLVSSGIGTGSSTATTATDSSSSFKETAPGVTSVSSARSSRTDSCSDDAPVKRRRLNG